MTKTIEPDTKRQLQYVIQRIKQLYKNIFGNEYSTRYGRKNALFLEGNCDKTTKFCLEGGHILYLIYIILVLKNKNHVLTLIICTIYCVKNFWLFQISLGKKTNTGRQ